MALNSCECFEVETITSYQRKQAWPRRPRHSLSNPTDSRSLLFPTPDRVLHRSRIYQSRIDLSQTILAANVSYWAEDCRYQSEVRDSSAANPLAKNNGNHGRSPAIYFHYLVGPRSSRNDPYRRSPYAGHTGSFSTAPTAAYLAVPEQTLNNTDNKVM